MQHYAGFISADSLYMFRASGAHHHEYLKTGTAATGMCVTVAGKSSHHNLVPCQFINTPDDGRLTPETCRVSLQK